MIYLFQFKRKAQIVYLCSIVHTNITELIYFTLFDFSIKTYNHRLVLNPCTTYVFLFFFSLSLCKLQYLSHKIKLDFLIFSELAHFANLFHLDVHLWFKMTENLLIKDTCIYITLCLSLLVLLLLFPWGRLRRANWSSYTCRHFHATIYHHTLARWLFSLALQSVTRTQTHALNTSKIHTKGLAHTLTDKLSCLILYTCFHTHARTHTPLHFNLYGRQNLWVIYFQPFPGGFTGLSPYSIWSQCSLSMSALYESSPSSPVCLCVHVCLQAS